MREKGDLKEEAWREREKREPLYSHADGIAGAPELSRPGNRNLAFGPGRPGGFRQSSAVWALVPTLNNLAVTPSLLSVSPS